ncbi:anti-lipopolysaccharide factor-like [Cherax quadricarinatus]
MRTATLVSVVVVSLLVAPLVPQSNAQIWEAIAGAVTNKVISLWDHGEVELMEHYCNYIVTPMIRRWQLYYRGRMWCPGWTTIRAEATTRSRSGVIGDTTRDFVRKAFQAGIITEQEARAWLNS